MQQRRVARISQPCLKGCDVGGGPAHGVLPEHHDKLSCLPQGVLGGRQLGTLRVRVPGQEEERGAGREGLVASPWGSSVAASLAPSGSGSLGRRREGRGGKRGSCELTA